MVGNSTDETYFPRKLLLTNTQVASEWIENEIKEQKDGLFGVLLGTLAATL